MELLSPGILFLLSILLFTAFAKIFTTLSILSVGLGMRGFGFGIVMAALSLVLSWLITQPYLGDASVVRALSQAQLGDVIAFEERVRPFLERHSKAEIKDSISQISGKINAQATPIEKPKEASPISVLGVSFLISQLRDAFLLGLIFLIPFVVIDLVVTNILMLLGITQLSTAVVSLPIKILIFVAIDGWTMVSERLLNTYIIS